MLSQGGEYWGIATQSSTMGTLNVNKNHLDFNNWTHQFQNNLWGQRWANKQPRYQEQLLKKYFKTKKKSDESTSKFFLMLDIMSFKGYF